MSENYTILNQKDVSKYALNLENFNEYDKHIDYYAENVMDYIKNSDFFRPFDEGLIELLKRAGYSGSFEKKVEMSDYLIARLREINSTIKAETVYSWFFGEHRPKIEPGYRRHIYEICFALHLTYDDTVWFFQHVYYDRAFNCHTIDEAVFYYAFLHHLTYSEALSVIDRVDRVPVAADTADTAGPNYTQWLKNRISGFQSVYELEAFLSSNKNNFNSWNKSALNHLNRLISELVASDEAKKKIDGLKRKLNSENPNYNQINSDIGNYENTFQGCGLLMKEVFYDALHSAKNPAYKEVRDTICRGNASKSEEEKKKRDGSINIQKSTFILDRMLSSVSGIPKLQTDDKVSLVFRNIFCHNFPSKKIMSDVLSEPKITSSKSYDSIRKMIILLDFYAFWIPEKIHQPTKSAYSNDMLYQIYKDEANCRLFQCGYEDLCSGNPYDWLFLCAARSDDPLLFFRACTYALLEEAEKND